MPSSMSEINFDSAPPSEGKDVRDTKMLEPRTGAEPYATGKPMYSQEMTKQKGFGALGIMGHCEDGGGR